MATFTKQLLSASTNGRQIYINGSHSGSATTVHTAPAGTTSFDEVYLYATNIATGSVVMGVWWGGTTTPNDMSLIAIPNQAGRVLIADGKLIQSGSVISAWSTVSASILVDGFCNRITP